MKITDLRIISSLEKIYDDESIPERKTESLSMLKNEKKM